MLELEKIADRSKKDILSLGKWKNTTPEKQITFLKEVMFNQEECDKLLEDPEGYCNAQKITLDKAIVEAVENVVMYGAPIDEKVVKSCGKNGVTELEKLQKTVDRLQRYLPKRIEIHEKSKGNIFANLGDWGDDRIVPAKLAERIHFAKLLDTLEKINFKNEILSQMRLELQNAGYKIV